MENSKDNGEGARQLVVGEAGQIEMLNRKIIELQERIEKRDKQKAQLCEEIRQMGKQHAIMLSTLNISADLYEDSSKACHRMMDTARESVQPHIEAEREACAALIDLNAEKAKAKMNAGAMSPDEFDKTAIVAASFMKAAELIRGRK